jgi:hypothetical protein
MAQLAGGVTADQLSPMAVEDEAVAVSPVGAEGTALQDAAEVFALACVDADEVPSASTASTT